MSNKEMAILELRKILTTRRDIIIRAANSELINLFWQIGIQLKQIKAAYSIDRQRVDIQTISNILKKQYRNNFFSTSQLRKMELFVEFFPSIEEVNAISYLLNWKHILLFLKIKDNEIRNYYVKLTIQNDFSPKELEAKMNKSIGKGTSLIRVNSLHLSDKTYDTKTILDCLIHTTKKKFQIAEILKAFLTSRFFRFIVH